MSKLSVETLKLFKELESIEPLNRNVCITTCRDNYDSCLNGGKDTEEECAEKFRKCMRDCRNNHLNSDTAASQTEKINEIIEKIIASVG